MCGKTAAENTGAVNGCGKHRWTAANANESLGSLTGFCDALTGTILQFFLPRSHIVRVAASCSGEAVRALSVELLHAA